jgi:hypothetical protein
VLCILAKVVQLLVEVFPPVVPRHRSQLNALRQRLS